MLPHVFLSKSDPSCPPENTISFIEYALSNGFDGVYLKGQTASNGEPYLFSEETTQRLCGEGGFFCYHAPEELSKLRMNGHPIPSLQYALDTLFSATKRPFSVHIHAMNARALDAMAQLLLRFRKVRGHLRLLLVCADASAIQRAKQKYPEIAFALYMPGVPLLYAQDAATCLADAVYLPEAFHSVPLIRDAQAKHLKVYIEGLPSAAHLSRLRALSVDGVAGTPDLNPAVNEL